MATVNLGAIKFNWKGAYNNATAYVADDVVSSGGNSYVCILASTGNAVSNGTYWSLMAQAGTNGTDGTTVGLGTAGQVLKTNSGASAIEWADPAGGAGTPNVVTYSSQNVLHGSTTNLIGAIQSSSGTHGYSASTGIWTCPTAGLWLYAPTIYIYGSNDAVEMEIRVITSQIPGGQSGMYFPGDFKTTGSYAYEVTGNCALLFQATVGDTAYVTGYQNSGATWTADVVHNICRLGD